MIRTLYSRTAAPALLTLAYRIREREMEGRMRCLDAVAGANPEDRIVAYRWLRRTLAWRIGEVRLAVASLLDVLGSLR